MPEPGKPSMMQAYLDTMDRLESELLDQALADPDSAVSMALGLFKQQAEAARTRARAGEFDTRRAIAGSMRRCENLPCPRCDAAVQAWHGWNGIEDHEYQDG